jgi:hypothetical protein
MREDSFSVGIFAAADRRRQYAAALGDHSNNALERAQSGGWARQVTQADFAVADTISDVNTRLTCGGIRNWHELAELASMTHTAAGGHISALAVGLGRDA